MTNPSIAVIMGSDSDWPCMKAAHDVLVEAGVEVHSEVVSAHRTPDRMFAFSREARSQGFSAIIAGAGGAAHLPGMVASLTTLPVIGVPISLNSFDGLDSLLSIVQMPAGVPVATVGVGQARNAGLLALRFLSVPHREISQFLEDFRASQEEAVLAKKLT